MSLSNSELLEILKKRASAAHEVDPREWAVRVELAACYRLLARLRMTDWVYNHISARVPGNHEHYLINAFGLLYEEVSASNLVKVDVHGNLVEDVPLDVNPAAFIVHGAIHSARPDAGCVLHTHTDAGVAVAAQQEGLLPISQHAMRFYGRTAFHDFEGIALSEDEKARLVRDLGNKNVLILRNHGLLTLGRTVADAFKEMFFLERACQIQVRALAGGRALSIPSDAVCVHASEQFSRDSEWLQGRDWNAYLRMLDRLEPDYAS